MKKYNKIILGIIIGGILAVVMLNVTMDIYRIFRVVEWNKRYVDANLRYLKVEHLRKHVHEFDAFIMGTSRSNFYNRERASRLTGFTYYNFASAAERLDRIYQKLLWLKREKVEIKQLVLALDFDFMFLADDLNENTLVTNEHYLVIGQSPLDFYLPYFIKFDSNNWRKCLRNNMFRKKPIAYKFLPELGHWYFIDKDELIARDHEKYLKENFSYEMPYEKGKDRVPVNLDRLRTIMDFIRAQNIPTVVVLNPVHHSSFKTFDEREYAAWRRSVVEICGEVWDFSSPSSVTRDDHLFYESSHFRWPVGDMVLDRIFSDKISASERQKLPADFGVLLKERNI